MKNISNILNVVLLVAVAGLYYLHFTSNSSDQAEQVSEAGLVENPSIVYVNSDSIVANYQYIKDKQTELEERSKKLDAEFKNRAQGLQTEINNYQRNANSMTIGQARAVEEDLMKKQQNLKMYEQGLAQELLGEEAKINKELFDKVSSLVKAYGEQKGVHLVVKFDNSSDVLYANKGMDITNEVITQLNEEYLNPETNDSVKADSTSAQ